MQYITVAGNANQVSGLTSLRAWSEWKLSRRTSDDLLGVSENKVCIWTGCSGYVRRHYLAGYLKADHRISKSVNE